MDENTQRIKEKLDFFYDHKLKVHVIKHKNNEFLNGFLVDKEDEGVFILNEDVDGKIRIFAADIYDVSEFKEKVE